MSSVGKVIVYRQVCCNIWQKYDSFSPKLFGEKFSSKSFSAILRLKKSSEVPAFIVVGYKDRSVERQIRGPEALFRRLATLPLSDFVP